MSIVEKNVKINQKSDYITVRAFSKLYPHSYYSGTLSTMTHSSGECVDNYNTPLDYFLATLLMTCMVLGMPANVVAFEFFRRGPLTSVSTTIYIAIVATDFILCFIHFPVAISLYGDRAPILLGYGLLCASWEIIFSLCQRYSMFLVMLLSVTRTIAITRPFRVENKTSVLVAMVGYLIFLIAHFIVSIIAKIEFIYRQKGAYCYRNISETNFFTKIHMTLLNMEVGIPPIVSFISLLICGICLKRSSISATQKHRKKAFVTIALFTGSFLLCNLPYFINMMIAIEALIFNKTQQDHEKKVTPYMNYLDMISKINGAVLSSTINPFLYFYRMQVFRKSVTSSLFNRNLSSPLGNDRDSRSQGRAYPHSRPKYGDPADNSRPHPQRRGRCSVPGQILPPVFY